MFDRALRRRVDPFLDRLAITVRDRGFRADQITWAGFAVGVAGMAAIAGGHNRLGLILLLINRFCDGLDGAVARATAPTDRGAYLDIVLDFLFYAGFVFACAVAEPTHALAAAFLIFSFVGSGTSFLAHAIFAAKRALPAEDARKGIAYLAGLTEGGETILVFVLMLIWPASFPTLAIVFGALCWLTTIMRIAGTTRLLR